MKATNDEPNALKACTVKDRKQMFESHNAALDKIQKSLEEYLETKRAAVPRFYFLADDELLQILAQALLILLPFKFFCLCFVCAVNGGRGDGCLITLT